MKMAYKAVEIKTEGKNVIVKVRRVVIAFADVWEAHQGTNDQGELQDRFSVSANILFDKTTKDGKEQIAAIREAMKLARAAEWSKDAPNISPDRLCLQDGEPKDIDTGEPKARWEGYEHRMYVNAKKYLRAKTKEGAAQELKEKHPVQLLGSRKTARDQNGNPCFPILKESDDLIYSGAICDVVFQIYPFNGTGKGPNGKNLPHRINCSLEAIKFVEHGTRMGGGRRVDAQSMFDEEETEDDTTSSAEVDDDPLA
jgi:hypothetical protein